MGHKWKGVGHKWKRVGLMRVATSWKGVGLMRVGHKWKGVGHKLEGSGPWQRDLTDDVVGLPPPQVCVR